MGLGRWLRRGRRDRVRSAAEIRALLRHPASGSLSEDSRRWWEFQERLATAQEIEQARS